MFYLGIDLGQRRDHTAIAVLERWDCGRAFLSSVVHHLEVRYVERVPLGTPYTAVVERVRRLVQHERVAGMRGDGGVDYGRGAGESVGLRVECAEAGFDCRGAGFAGTRGIEDFKKAAGFTRAREGTSGCADEFGWRRQGPDGGGRKR